jgi:hypothetical protein
MPEQSRRFVAVLAPLVQIPVELDEQFVGTAHERSERDPSEARVEPSRGSGRAPRIRAKAAGFARASRHNSYGARTSSTRCSSAALDEGCSAR